MENYLEIANGPVMWLVCGMAVALVIIQSILFLRKSITSGRELGITNQQLRHAAKASAISAIGPSLVILAGMISLLVTMGGPIALMRLSYIGSVQFELMSAEFGAQAVGVSLDGPDMNAIAFTNGVWVMALGSFGWVLFTALCTHKMDKFRYVLAGGRKAFLPILSVAAMLGAFGYLASDRIMRFDQGAVSCVAGFVLMAAIGLVNQKWKKQWLKEWSMCIAMFGGMLIAVALY